MSEPKLVTNWEAMCKDRDDEIETLEKQLAESKAEKEAYLRKYIDIIRRKKEQLKSEEFRSAELLETLKDEVKFIKEVLGTDASDLSYGLIADAEKGRAE